MTTVFVNKPVKLAVYCYFKHLIIIAIISDKKMQAKCKRENLTSLDWIW